MADLDRLGELYPVAIVQDRYRGTYSRGSWLAVANADEREGVSSRVDFVLNSGPHGSDPDAAEFWSQPPDWIAEGSTPDEALANLLSNNG